MISTTASTALIHHIIRSGEFVIRRKDATKTKKMNHQCLIANVTKLVVPVDIVMIQLGSTTASPALIHHIKSPQCMMMEVDIVK
jgi:hypothetical protein